jgi:anti-anti-sigma factor
MATDLKISLHEHGKPVRLVAEGGIDIRTAGTFRTALDHATARHDRLVVDLTGVRFLSDDGVDALDGHSGRISPVLVGMDSPITSALRVAGLARWIVYQTRAQMRPRRWCTGTRVKPVATERYGRRAQLVDARETRSDSEASEHTMPQLRGH